MKINKNNENKNFWKVVKPNFSNKIVGTNRMILTDGDKIVSDTEKVVDTFNKFFVDIRHILNKDKDKWFLVETLDVFDPVLKAIKKYSAHPSILSIKEKMNNNVFSFQNVNYEEKLNEINSLDTWKSTQSENIPFKIIKDTAGIFANFILQCIKEFYDQLKLTLVLFLKKGNHNDNTKYRPVSTYSHFQKFMSVSLITKWQKMPY